MAGLPKLTEPDHNIEQPASWLRLAPHNVLHSLVIEQNSPIACYYHRRGIRIAKQQNSMLFSYKRGNSKIAYYFHNIRGELRINSKIACYFHIKGEIAKQQNSMLLLVWSVKKQHIEQHGKIINSRDNKQHGFTIEIYGEIA